MGEAIWYKKKNNLWGFAFIDLYANLKAVQSQNNSLHQLEIC